MFPRIVGTFPTIGLIAVGLGAMLLAFQLVGALGPEVGMGERRDFEPFEWGKALLILSLGAAAAGPVFSLQVGGVVFIAFVGLMLCAPVLGYLDTRTWPGLRESVAASVGVCLFLGGLKLGGYLEKRRAVNTRHRAPWRNSGGALSRTLDALSNLPGDSPGRARLLADIRTVAAQDPATLAGFLKRLDLSDPDEASAHFDVFEALAGDSRRWHRFTLDEFDRVCALCDEDPNPSRLGVLDSFMWMEKDAALEQDLVRRYLEALDSSHAAVRRRIIRNLLPADMMTSDDRVFEAIKRKLEDPDWTVRAAAEDALQEAGRLPSSYRPRFMDRVRRLFFA